LRPGNFIRPDKGHYVPVSGSPLRPANKNLARNLSY
jgi:hypothetical protein